MISSPIMLDAITNYFSSMSPTTLYFALFVSAYVENVVPPVPGDTVTVFAAYLVGRSQQHFIGVFLSTTIGSMAGFMTIYALGRLVRPDYFVRKNYRILPAASIQKAGDWLRQYGYWLLLANRFLSGIRSVISIVAGAYRLPWFYVLVWTGISCAVWNGLLIWAGYLLGANWRMAEDILRQYSRFLMAGLIIAVVVWIVRKQLSSRRPQ